MKRYLLFKTENMHMLLWVLEELNYKSPEKTPSIIQLILSQPSDFEILIDKKEKKYFIIANRKSLAEVISGSVKVYTSDDTDAVLNFLEVNVTAEEIDDYVQRQYRNGEEPKLRDIESAPEESNEEVNVDEIMQHPLMKAFRSVIPENKLREAVCFAAEERKKEHQAKEETSKSTEEESDFYQELLPGRVVKFENAGMVRYGIVLSNGTVMHFSGSNLAASGYINNITPDRPYHVASILKPTSEYYNLKDVNNMEVAWKRPVKKSKRDMTIQDIEKKLGLEPGSLNIV